MGTLTRVGFDLAARTRLRRYLYYRYSYEFTPRQLAVLTECLTRTAHVAGTIMEIGCAYGHTTAFLNRHLDAVDDQRPYVCIDTFEGFTPNDVAFEQQARGKAPGEFNGRFADVSLRGFQRTMANNDITRVSAIKADIGSWFPAADLKVSFCLIDVDLFKPVEAALQKIAPLLQSGGIIVIDDCQDHPLWDGALQAYTEHVTRQGLPSVILEGKLGIIGEIDRVHPLL